MTEYPIFSPWPSFTEEEGEAVKKTLLSNKVNYWTGKESVLFEEEFAKWSRAKYAIAVANGTLALDIALKAINIVENDEVVVTPRTFIASVSSIVNIGAIPVFADVELAMQNNLQLPDDTAIKISSEGLLGGYFVELQPGGSPFNFEEGDTIVNTQGSVGLLNLLMKFGSGSGN